ncbi:MAG: glutamyl-tRNA reductase, partial [Acidobacteria bacterium]|nr:glutamyl-tRNA reductase [Acidobacteriota bacterium]
AFPDEQLHPALMRLQTEFGLREGMIISTCNRVEVFAHGQKSQEQIIESVKEFLYSSHALQPRFLEDYLYSHLQRDAVRHIFRVASSLDSMVVGEPQILAQVKQAYAVACQAGSVGTYLKDLIPRAFFVAKKVRSSTQIGASAVSISSVAVELARKIFGDLTGKSTLLLGAGEMGELAARSLLDSGISQLFITNRTPQRSQELAAQLLGKAVPFADLETYLVRCDIALVCTGSTSLLLDKNRLEKIIKRRKYRPLFIIDISVPRNIDPHVNELENVFLYDVDDLQSVINANIRQRCEEAETAEDIVQTEVAKYMNQQSTRGTGPLISALRQRIEEICLEELKSNHGNLDRQEYQRLEKALKSTAHRIAHPVIAEIRQADEDPTRRLHKIEMVRKIFRLDEKP